MKIFKKELLQNLPLNPNEHYIETIKRGSLYKIYHYGNRVLYEAILRSYKIVEDHSWTSTITCEGD